MRICVYVVGLFAVQAAVAQDCLLNGGKLFCGTQVPNHFVLAACDEAGSGQQNRLRAWCEAAGGTFQTDQTCLGDTPHDDGNIVERSRVRRRCTPALAR